MNQIVIFSIDKIEMFISYRQGRFWLNLIELVLHNLWIPMKNFQSENSNGKQMVALASYGKDNIFDQEFDGLGEFTF